MGLENRSHAPLAKFLEQPISIREWELLQQWSEGNKSALDSLTPVVYDELRRLASIHLHRERSDHTLQATAVVHEAYMRLVDQRSVRWQNRAHFFGIAAQMIRRILVDHARGVRAAKRGSGAVALSLDEALASTMMRVGRNAAAHCVALARSPLVCVRKLKDFALKVNDAAAFAASADKRRLSPR